MPLISVICPCFNHEKYVTFFIQSVLDQTYRNFELIIVDDCSVDTSVQQIKKFDDKRIKLIQHKFNNGVNAAVNTGIENSTGEIIIFVDSDDMLKQNYMEKIVEIFRNSPEVGVIYGPAIVIDDNNKIFKKQPRYFSSTHKMNDKNKVLSSIFYDENVLVASGMAVRRSVLQKIIPLDTSFLNHQDTFIHIRLLAITNMALLSEPYVLYRIRSDKQNLSAAKKSTTKREALEIPRLMNTFLTIGNADVIKYILNRSGIELKDARLIPYYLGFAALHSKDENRQRWGYSTIMEFISQQKNFELLNKIEGFTCAYLLGLVSNFKTKEDKYRKYKKLFNFSLIICAILAAFVAKLIVA